MWHSTERILTTHVGRLQRPDEITAAMESHSGGRPTDAAFATRLRAAVADVVREQRDAGVDIVCDGEFGKISWITYLNTRLGGHELIPIEPAEAVERTSIERTEFAQFYRELESGGSHYYKSPGSDAPHGMHWVCTGPVKYIGQQALQQDLQNLAQAVSNAKIEEAFIPATSPIILRMNRFYPHEDEYFEAVAEALREEYRAIVDAGFILQIDDPHLPDQWDSHYSESSIAEYRKVAEKHVSLLNHALRGIPEDRMRYHICWGSWHGPHVYDLPLKHIIDILLKVKVQGYVIEAANARHEHEWQLWKDTKLPDGKVLIPGVVAHATNVVEHPELIAWRIRNFASMVGKENVIAGTDCGMGYRVHRQIGWAKLKALGEGARLASRELWRS